jgi:hypothetical protein
VTDQSFGVQAGQDRPQTSSTEVSGHAGNSGSRTGFHTSMRRVSAVFLAALSFCFPAMSCECDQGAIECSYAAAQIVFRGRVDYDNDNGSGSFIQKTLIRFKVSEILKGLPSNNDHVWVDPGSFTSCYAEYGWGKEYLVFAYRGAAMPAETAAMTVAEPGPSRKKLPPEFASENPPPIYFAPECTGTRGTDYVGFDSDLTALRQYAQGTPIPRVVGQVFLSPYPPGSAKGRLAGVQISVKVGDNLWRAETNADGKFFFYKLPPEGSYEATATYPGAIVQRGSLRVFSRVCSYLYLEILSMHSIHGRILDGMGAPARGLTLGAQLATHTDDDRRPFTTTQTDMDGRFDLVGMPPEPVRVDVFSTSTNRAVAANPPVYYGDAILASDSHPDPAILIRMPRHVHKRWVRIHVRFSDGAPARRATVFIRDGNTNQLDIDTDENGNGAALLACDVQYDVQAWRLLDPHVFSDSLLSKTVQLKVSLSATLTLVLDHVRRYGHDSD